MLDISKIKAISIDLTIPLWPIWPTIERAERCCTMADRPRAPMQAAALFSSPMVLCETATTWLPTGPDLKLTT